MKFFSRMMMVIALLAVLAYGSFAFGKYVLSAKLFGDDANSSSLRTVSRSTTEASAVTRQTGWKGTKPRVEVKVLPADQIGGGTNLPTFADEDGFSKSRSDEKDNSPRRTSRAAKPDPTPAARLGKREFDNGSAEYSLGREDDDDEPRRSTRRRRRTRPKKSDNDTKPKRSESDSASSTATSSSSSESSNSSGDSASSSVTTGSSSSPSSERSSDAGTQSRESTRSESKRSSSESTRSSNSRSESSRNRESSRPRRERSRRDTSSSPIPRPEGLSSSGGDSASISPVPRPE